MSDCENFGPYGADRVKAALRACGCAPNRALGQNFLIDKDVAGRIIALGSAPCALEIGPGLGALTFLLAKTRERVAAVELDRALKDGLARALKGAHGVSVICADAMKADLAACTAGLGGPYDVFSNLPYYITTDLVLRLLTQCRREGGAQAMAFMMQSEAAARLLAAPGAREYGPAALVTQYLSAPERCFDVPAHCFFPQPGVLSCVVRLKLKPAALGGEAEARLLTLIRAAFANRRKTLLNNLSQHLGGGADARANAEALLRACGIDPGERAERLPLEKFMRMAEIMPGIN